MNPQYKLHTFSDGTTNETQLQSIYDLNQSNTPEVGSLESMNHLKQLIEPGPQLRLLYIPFDLPPFLLKKP